MHRGYIKLWRKAQENVLWRKRRQFSEFEAWLDILMEARYQEEPAQTWIGGKMVEVNQGEVLYSMETWARRWGWNRLRVRRYLQTLNHMSMVVYFCDTRTTHLKVLNYKQYQETRTSNELPMNCQRTANELPMNTTKEGKNVRRKEERKDNAPTVRKKTNGSEPASPISLCPETFKWQNITDLNMTQWKQAHPACDIQTELAKASLYIKTHPAKWKKNWERFLVGWFGRSQQWGGTRKRQCDDAELDAWMKEPVNEDAWKI